jgi:hypothetical protein
MFSAVRADFWHALAAEGLLTGDAVTAAQSRVRNGEAVDVAILGAAESGAFDADARRRLRALLAASVDLQPDDEGRLGRANAASMSKLPPDWMDRPTLVCVGADARTLEELTSGGWQVRTVDGPVTAREAVVALGPWSNEILAPLGAGVPLGVKRGYHMHFKTRGNATLSRPVVDVDNGYLLTPMTKGIRLTTGAEFASRTAPPSPVQLGKVEPIAREVFPLADRADEKPWKGARPCLPDMVPMIGQIPRRKGLWADFGHHHLGFTLGPATGRLLAEMMTGEPAYTDPWPYRADRFS